MEKSVPQKLQKNVISAQRLTRRPLTAQSHFEILDSGEKKRLDRPIFRTFSEKFRL